MLWVAAAAVAAGSGGAGPAGGELGVAVFTPREAGGDLCPLYEGSIYYFLHPKMEVAAAVGYAFYEGGGYAYRYFPGNIRVKYHFRFKREFDPYLGGGPLYAWKRRDGVGRGTWGYSLVSGVNRNLKGHISFGAGVEYTAPDAADMDSGYPSFMIKTGWAGL